ncbi:MAG: 16S rRNA (cytidine(1402)-2'-O)-methyltransferase [Gammaproteobacteria bacterium]
MNINHFGTLYIVATPIGNLRDMSLRAIDILKTVNCIAAEDTRHSKSLLQHYMINTPMFALHQHNEREKSTALLERLQQGDSIALISDAGTPLISDPGYFLVREARVAGITIVPIPGACAAITALSASGLATDRFSFEGFLPAKTKQRVQSLETLRTEARTMVFYEAPHRVLDTLEDMQKVFGEKRQVVLARELTKLYETIRSAALDELVEWVKNDDNQQRGEIVIMVEGANSAVPESAEIVSAENILKILMNELPLKQAVDLAAKISGLRKNELYQRALELK